MLALLKTAGMANGLKGGNGQDWEQNLVAAGWKPVRCLTPYNAPLGSVLVYLGAHEMMDKYIDQRRDRRCGKRRTHDHGCQREEPGPTDDGGD